MTASWVLTKMFWRQTRLATLFGVIAMCHWSLGSYDVMTARDFWPGLIVLVHCLLLGRKLGRFESPQFAFLYSRGYTRDTVWGSMMLASNLSAVAAWLPAALFVWTGLRSRLHDLLQSPYFPIMAPREAWVPLIWLGLYVLLVPACHYAWIRRAQPTRGSQGGGLAVVGVLVALLLGFDMVRRLDGWFAWLCGLLYAAVVVCLLLGSRSLHRSLEVRS